jgi:S-formylglutathione hydrolase FrmB
VVMPNAFTLHKGSMYSNSVTTGDWETYVARDLVAYVDSHYRTIPNRMSRGLAGHSMGGYGAVRIGMKRPDVFSSLYLMSSCCLTATLTFDPGRMAPAEAIKTREAAADAGRGRGFGPSVNLAEGAAWSPNPNNPPLYLDLPVKDGLLQPDVIAKWAANAPLAMVGQYIPNLKMYHAIAMEVGTKDGLLASNKELAQTFTKFGVQHTYEEYDGDHTNKVFERIEQNVLPFFSKNLSFDSRTSSTKH